MPSTASLPLTSVTADSIKQAMIDFLSASFPGWTDQADSNNMITLLEGFAGAMELQYTYLNHLARECYLQFAIDPRNVFALAADLGYKPQYQTPAQVQGTISLATGPTANTPIPAGTKFASLLDGVFYETDATVTVNAGVTTSPTVTFKQQESWSQTFTGTGAPGQTLTLNHSPVLPTTVEVVIDGDTWAAVDSFVEQDSTSQVYTWFLDSVGVYSIQFGDGLTGKCPPVSASGTVNFKTGGGKANTIGANQLLQNVTEVLDAGTSQPLQLTGVNPTAATPGSDMETSDQIRVNAPAARQAPAVCLITDDVTNWAKTVAGVQDARAVNWQTDPAIPHHLMQLFIRPVGGGLADSTLKAAVMAAFTVKPVVGLELAIVDPTTRTINFDITLVVKPNYDHGAVALLIQNALTNLFDPTIPNIWGFIPDFGQQIYMSELVMILQQIPGVLGLSINTPGDQLLNYYEFPELGTVTVH